MSAMTFPGEPGAHHEAGEAGEAAGEAGGHGRQSRAGERAWYSPMEFDGVSWVPLAEPQPTPRAACLAVAAYLHLFLPGTPRCDLDARAEGAIRALEGGAESVTVIDNLHRVDHVDLRRARHDGR